MSTKSTFCTIFLALLLASGCKPKQPVSSPGESPTQPTVVVTPQPPAATCGGVISRGAPSHKDPFSQFSTSLEGDCLKLKYSYSGGCKEHDVAAYWNGSWAETIPPGTHLYISHNANGDACEAIKSGASSFDLTPLRYQGVGQVVIDVHVEGFPMMRINYIYKSN